jgi:hypothetical protein
VHSSRNSRKAGAVQRKAVGGREQDFEEDRKIEQVACEKRAVDAHQHKLKQGMEKHAYAMPAR